jgi:hypothetical protein
MKLFKAFLFMLAAGFVALFGYANLRVLSPGERMKPVELSSFHLDGKLDQTNCFALEQQIENTPGVNACTINEKSKTACVIYDYSQLQETRLVSLLGNNGTIRVEKKDLAAAGGGCPVHKVSASLSHLLTTLDLRSY